MNLLRILYWSVMARLLKGFSFGSFASVYGPRKIKNTALGLYEKETVECLLELEFDVLLDVGANIGMFSRMFENKSQLSFVLVEPDRRLLPLLEHNMRHAASKLVLPLGCDDKNRIAKFYVHENPLVNSRDDAVSSVGSEYKGIEATPFFTLDDIAVAADIGDAPFVLKLDVEGGEMNLLTNLSPALRQSCVAAVLEIGRHEHEHIETTREMLTEMGFGTVMLCDVSLTENGEFNHCNLVACR